MRPSGDLIFGALLRLAIMYAAAMSFLIFWPVGVALIGLALFMPWPDKPDWVTPEPEPEAAEEEEEAQPREEPFWMWNR